MEAKYLFISILPLYSHTELSSILYLPNVALEPAVMVSELMKWPKP